MIFPDLKRMIAVVWMIPLLVCFNYCTATASSYGRLASSSSLDGISSTHWNVRNQQHIRTSIRRMVQEQHQQTQPRKNDNDSQRNAELWIRNVCGNLLKQGDPNMSSSSSISPSTTSLQTVSMITSIEVMNALRNTKVGEIAIPKNKNGSTNTIILNEIGVTKASQLNFRIRITKNESNHDTNATQFFHILVRGASNFQTVTQMNANQTSVHVCANNNSSNSDRIPPCGTKLKLGESTITIFPYSCSNSSRNPSDPVIVPLGNPSEMRMNIMESTPPYCFPKVLHIIECPYVSNTLVCLSSILILILILFCFARFIHFNYFVTQLQQTVPWSMGIVSCHSHPSR